MTDAADNYDSYYAEKIWELVPAIYRLKDGLASPPDVLRSMVEIIARNAAVLRRSQDRLWDDQYIDLCDDWAIPYIGDLVATRMVSALDTRAQRIDVAKTIYYRRRKGTPAVLEELIADITGWDGTLVEEFRRLARHQHALDPQPAGRLGRVTGTPQGGWADVRSLRGGRLDRGPFGEWAHRPDMRRFHGGKLGRYGIPKLGFHLYRAAALEIDDVTPFKRTADATGASFTCDPSGRDVPLFQLHNRSPYTTGGTPTWQRALEWQIAAPMTCELLNDAIYAFTDSQLSTLGLPATVIPDLEKLAGIRFRDQARLRARVSAAPAVALLPAAQIPPIADAIVAVALVPDCGHSVLLVDNPTPTLQITASFHLALPVPTVIPPDAIFGATLATWRAGLAAPANALVLVDPARGRVQMTTAEAARPTGVSYVYGSPGPIGAGAFSRTTLVPVPAVADHVTGGGPLGATFVVAAGAKQIDDNRTYGPLADQAAITSLVIQSGDLKRPYLQLASDWTLTGVVDASGNAASLVLDGLWIGGTGKLILAGVFAQVTFRNVTLDPGGGAGGDTDANGVVLPAVALAIGAEVETFVIERCITGPIATQGTGEVETLTISDSIVQSIAFTTGTVSADALTVLGSSAFHRLDATDSLFVGEVDVLDTQRGCFRFSAAPSTSRLPHPFAVFPLDNADAVFESQRFGSPGYARLRAIAPVGLARGAESGSEMGAWCSFIEPIKLDSLTAKVEEYMPFGLVPMFIPET